MDEKRFSIAERLKSFGFAFNGIKLFFRSEHNARIHVVVAGIALLAASLLKIEKNEWMAIILAIGFVITTEIMNTAIEKIADFISPGYHDKIKIIKDLAAAAVLVSVFAAVAIGLIIFIPKIF